MKAFHIPAFSVSSNIAVEASFAPEYDSQWNVKGYTTPGPMCGCCGAGWCGDKPDMMNKLNRGVMIGLDIMPKADLSEGSEWEYVHLPLGDSVLTMKFSTQT